MDKREVIRKLKKYKELISDQIDVKEIILFGSYASGTAGSYVSGITAQLIKGDEIIAAASETQVRTDFRIPDPPEVMARKIGKEIRKMLGR